MAHSIPSVNPTGHLSFIFLEELQMPHGGAGRFTSVFCSSRLVFRVAVFHISGYFITSLSPSFRVPAFHISGLHVLLLNILKSLISRLRVPYFGFPRPVTQHPQAPHLACPSPVFHVPATHISGPRVLLLG